MAALSGSLAHISTAGRWGCPKALWSRGSFFPLSLLLSLPSSLSTLVGVGQVRRGSIWAVAVELRYGTGGTCPPLERGHDLHVTNHR